MWNLLKIFPTFLVENLPACCSQDEIGKPVGKVVLIWFFLGESFCSYNNANNGKSHGERKFKENSNGHLLLLLRTARWILRRCWAFCCNSRSDTSPAPPECRRIGSCTHPCRSGLHRIMTTRMCNNPLSVQSRSEKYSYVTPVISDNGYHVWFYLS